MDLSLEMDQFIKTVIGEPFAMVLPDTSISSFTCSCDVVRERVRARYGVQLEDRHFRMPLWSLLQELLKERQARIN